MIVPLIKTDVQSFILNRFLIVYYALYVPSFIQHLFPHYTIITHMIVILHEKRSSEPMDKQIVVFYEMDPSSPTKENIFSIREIRHTPSLTDSPAPPIHRHPFYEMILLFQGEGTMKIDFKDYPMKEGSLFLFSPSKIHQPIVTKEMQGFLLRFDLSVFQDNEFFDNLSIFNFDYLSLCEADLPAILNLMESMCDEYQHERTLKHCTLSNLLKLFLIKIQRLLPDIVNETTYSTLFSILNKAIEENHFRVATPNDYAKKLKVPIKTLHTTVKGYTGISCGEYIRSKTIIQAKRLLSYTAMNASEIAFSLGFNDAAYFSRYFKRETGFSPVLFRKYSA